MKVRKFLFVGALIAASLFSVNSVMAQTNSTTATDQVVVNLKFKPIMSITVNPTDNEVDLTYADIADYSEGKTSGLLTNHINIYSTGGFEVKVKADGNFTRTGGGEISVGDVLIVATGTGASDTSDNSVYAAKQSLKATVEGETLVTKATGGVNINYNVEYDNTAAGGSNNYINKYIFADGAESVYSTTVTYTIAAK